MLIDVLHAGGPNPALADKLKTYAFLPGRWHADVLVHGEALGDRLHRGTCQIDAGWILDGRAIQDVWAIPDATQAARSAPQLPITGNWFGTTLRVYDPAIDAWRISWIDPARSTFMRQIGRAEGDRIVQLGKADDGRHWRWSFSDITDASFHWRAEVSLDDGRTWTLIVEVLARRTN